jgi:hypothetical protein
LFVNLVFISFLECEFWCLVESCERASSENGGAPEEEEEEEEVAAAGYKAKSTSSCVKLSEGGKT